MTMMIARRQLVGLSRMVSASLSSKVTPWKTIIGHCPPSFGASAFSGFRSLHHRRLSASSPSSAPFSCCRAVHHRRGFSSSSLNSNDIQQQQQQHQHRHSGIMMHPDSISKEIMPGNLVTKSSRYGKSKVHYTELVYGYFWNLKDLKRSNEQPILPNKEIIPENIAKVFPLLSGVQSLSSSSKLQLPDYFLRKNRSRDASAQCTLVAVSFRDFGYQLLSTWIEPFQNALAENSRNDRVEVYRLNISDGWINKWFLRGVIRGLMKRNTPQEEYDHTLLYFGGTAEDNFRDALRMHNVLTGFVFLLDGLGRVRFAGSGRAGDGEADRLIRFAKELTTVRRPQQKRPSGRNQTKGRQQR